MTGIRTDANKTIATGHIMRCMTIADELIALGDEVIFLVSDEESAAWLKERGFRYEILNSDWSNPTEEAERLAAFIKANGITRVLYDSYSFDKAYFEAVKSKTDSSVKSIYIDDLGSDTYPVDMLINYNAYAHTIGYDSMYPEGFNMLLGPMYAPLRPQFASTYKNEKYGQMQVLVASGGGDPYDVCLTVAKAIAQRRELNDIDFNIVVGGQSDNNELTRLAWCCHNIFLHKNVTKMAELMSKCDVAISAAGTMLTELCAMKVPTIEYVMADNQQQNSDYYSSQGLMIAGGDVRNGVEAVAERMVAELVELIDDGIRLRDMKAKLTGICDGQGAGRIAKEILCC